MTMATWTSFVEMHGMKAMAAFCQRMLFGDMVAPKLVDMKEVLPRWAPLWPCWGPLMWTSVDMCPSL
jgi:hypothetical protein